MPAYSPSSKGLFHVSGGEIVLSSKTERRIVTAVDGTDEVTHLKANASGTMLAVASGSAVQIFLIDPHEHKLARKFKNVVLESSIVGLEWHPAALRDAGLLILTQNRITNVYCTYDMLEISVERKQVVDSDNLPIDLVSFSFGSMDSPLGFATLYLASRDGELYRMLPIIPLATSVTPEQENQLRKYLPSTEFHTEFDTWCDRQRCATRALIRSTEEPSNSGKPDQKVSTVHLTPLKLRPYPFELYEEDTIAIKAGTVNWGVDVLVQTTQQFLNIYASPSTGLGSELVLISSLKFQNSDKAHMVDIFANETIVVNSTSKTILVDISGLLSALEDGELPSSDLVSVKIVEKGMPFLTRREIVLLSDKDSARGFPLPSVSSAASNSNQLADSLTSLDINEVQSGLFSDPEFFEKTVDALQSQMDLNPELSTGVNFEPTAKALFELETLSSHYQSQILTLCKFLMSLSSERQARERDITSQMASYEQVSEIGGKLITKARETQTKSVQAAIDRTQAFRTRLNKIRENIDAQVQSLPGHIASKSEQKWFDDLSNSIPTKIEQQSELLSRLKSRLDDLRVPELPSQNKDKKLSIGQILEIQQQLKEQSRSIDHIKSKILPTPMA